MPREVTASDGTTWTCAEAAEGLPPGEAAEAAVRDVSVRADDEGRTVVCTPSGGARPVRLHLGDDWEAALSDDDLLARIAAER